MERKKPKDVILQPYAKLFENFEYFNDVQSSLLSDLLTTDKSVVLSAPTGSGKTVAFELAIVKMLQETKDNFISDILPKAIYIAPIKALCSEKFDDWQKRFEALGVQCTQLTGDTESGNLAAISQAQIVISTPEKWDSLTRRWRDFKTILPSVQLFIIDEVHLLNEDTRGPILETIVARMKSSGVRRFIVASATIPNAEDLTKWIHGPDNQVSQYVFSEMQRPVPLEKHVLGYNSTLKGFQFDMKLNYQLPGVLRKYAENKAALIFCSSRKSAEMAAFNLNKGTPTFLELNFEQKTFLNQMAKQLLDVKLRKLFENGIAYHHAGLQYADRGLIESSFRQGSLKVLLSTSTLAMGINLPAHLVVIKSTETYIHGTYTEYPENMILQMIGRAGRPQYDNKGIAVLLTQNRNVKKYQMLVNGKSPIESHMHKNLAEHLNSEIALNTISNLRNAMNWVRSTYLYVRAVKNPSYYGFAPNLAKDFVERKLEELCLQQINELHTAGLVALNHVNGLDVETTVFGKLMAKYYICFETMKLFRQLNGNETLLGILNIITKCKELNEFTLRVNEKKILNELNKFPIRFPIKGRIKKYEEKISCLVQAVLGNIEITTPGLVQESLKIMRIADRVSKCLLEYIRLCVQKKMKSNNELDWYETLLNALILAKCFHAKLWENSVFVSKQLHGIGNVYSNILVNSGKTTLKSIAQTEARTIEMLLNKSPPFGDEVLQNLLTFPEYELSLKRSSPDFLQIYVKQINESCVYKGGSLAILIIGDSLNNILLLSENLNEILNEYGYFERKIKIEKFDEIENVYAHIVHTNIVGVDANESLEINPCKNKNDDKTKKLNLKGKRQRQSRLNVTVTEKMDTNISDEKEEEMEERNDVSNNEEDTIKHNKLKQFCYKKNKIQSKINMDESKTSTESIEENVNIRVVTNESANTTNTSNEMQRKITEFFIKRKKGEEVRENFKNIIDLNETENQRDLFIQNSCKISLTNEVINNCKENEVGKPSQQNKSQEKVSPIKRQVEPNESFGTIELSTPKKLRRLNSTNNSQKSNEVFLQQDNSFIKTISYPNSPTIQKIDIPNFNRNSAPITLASFLGNINNEVSITTLLAQEKTLPFKTLTVNNNEQNKKIQVNKNLANDSFLQNESFEIKNNNSLNLSNHLASFNLNGSLTHKPNPPVLLTTQNLTTFDNNFKLNPIQPTENEFILWYKVANEFRKFPRHALTLSNFRNTYNRIVGNFKQRGSLNTTESLKTSSSSSNLSMKSLTNSSKIDSGIVPNSSFRLKLFNDKESKREHNAFNSLEVKLINQNVMNFVLHSKGNYNKFISESLDELEKELDITPTQPKTINEKIFEN